MGRFSEIERSSNEKQGLEDPNYAPNQPFGLVLGA